MSSPDAPPSQEAPLAPEEVSDRTFPTAFRGFDPVEVRAFLGRVADELRAAQGRENELRRLLDEGGKDVPSALAAAEADAEAVVAAAKEEADRLLREAKERVSQLGAAATAETTRVLEEANAQAQQLVRTKGEEAETVAVKKIADAEREAAAIRVKAREDADSILEAAKERGREMVAEAQAARERMIADVAKRKRAATAQLDQLRASRDRLLESLRVVRRNLDEITTRLEVSEGQAAAAGDDGAGVARTAGGSSPAAVGAGVAASAGAAGAPADAPRKVARSTRVALGELPPKAPASPARADAPRARVAAEQPADPQVTRAAAEPPAQEAPAPVEERRSSALRILRRNRPAAGREPAVPPPGRESVGEGVRIIRTEEPPEPEHASAPPPAPEPHPVTEVAVGDADAAPAAEAAEAAEAAPGPASAPEPDPDPAVEDVAAETTAEAGPVPSPPDVADEDLPPPLRPEEVRPRIEDLFARLRADREQAVTGAREVLAERDSDAVVDVREPEAGDPPVASGDPAAQAKDADEHLLQARDVILDPLAGQLTKRLKRAIQDEQNVTLDRLRTVRGRLDASAVLATPDTQPAPYRYAALPLLEEAARSAASAAPFGTVAVGVDDLAQSLADELAEQIRSRVERALAESTGDDADVSSLSERVSAVYREWKTHKVERLAVHHLVAAWARGTFVATPEGSAMRWVVDDDGPCPDCDDNALAGATPRGEAFPTGQLHPPAHQGCRCLLAPATR
ncbi:MAG TPA: DivIVA domain-containing protein [Acidimicrobiales bacterium]